jgi:hypothetical protein
VAKIRGISFPARNVYLIKLNIRSVAAKPACMVGLHKEPVRHHLLGTTRPGSHIRCSAVCGRPEQETDKHDYETWWAGWGSGFAPSRASPVRGPPPGDRPCVLRSPHGSRSPGALRFLFVMDGYDSYATHAAGSAFTCVSRSLLLPVSCEAGDDCHFLTLRPFSCAPPVLTPQDLRGIPPLTSA